MTSKKNKELSFEEMLKELENIVTVMDNGQISLEESLSLYEQGINYIGKCNAELSKAENKIKVISRDTNGEIIIKEFENNDK